MSEKDDCIYKISVPFCDYFPPTQCLLSYFSQVLLMFFNVVNFNCVRKQIALQNLQVLAFSFSNIIYEASYLLFFFFLSDSFYSVEELLAMILEKAKEYAQDFAGMFGPIGVHYYYKLNLKL